MGETKAALIFAQAASTERALSEASVLLVDDQPARLLTYESILSGLPVRCVRALSGFQALERLLKEEFAVILLDVNMPGMDGFEVARLIRERPRLERMPIIFVTGANITELDRLKGYEVGAIDYLPVPVVPEILRTKVAVLVELHHRRGELQEINRRLQQARQQLELEHSRSLAQKDAQFLAVFEHPVQFMTILQADRNASGEIVDWYCRNANANALGLFAQSRDEVVGRRIAAVCPQHAEAFGALGGEVLANGQAVCRELQFGERIFSVTVYSMDGDSVIATGQDITGARQTELELRASERCHRALLENAPVAIAHNRMDGRFQYVNRAFCHLVGYTAEELYARTWQEITHPEDSQPEYALGNQALADKIPDNTIEKRYIRKNNTVVWARMFQHVVLDEGEGDRPVLRVAVAIDITKQRQAEEALRETQQRLVLAKAAARLGTHEWDLPSHLMKWDERTRQLWGVEAEEVVTYDTLVAGIHPDDRDRTREAIERALDPLGDGTYRAIHRVISRASGATRWLEASGQVYFLAGQARRLVGTVQDVTDQFVSMERLKQSEQRFRELANEQLRLQEELREADRRKDEFLALLAHELRNPVAPIRTAAEILARVLPEEQRVRASIAVIQRQTHHLSRLLDDLLDVARITQRRFELKRAVIDLRTCVETAIETVESIIREKRQRLTITQATAPLYVNVDNVRISLSITNLLSNAAKYTDFGGDIHIVSHAEQGMATIEVSDTGMGISADFLPRVFDLFSQARQSLDQSEGGLGVGLFICRELVEVHGGIVTAGSAGFGKGSTFTIRLPLSEAPDRVSCFSPGR